LKYSIDFITKGADGVSTCAGMNIMAAVEPREARSWSAGTLRPILWQSRRLRPNELEAQVEYQN
jgi:hypothetical protein